jgi:hypothetical protein
MATTTTLPGHGSLADLEQFIRRRAQRDGGVAIPVPLSWRSRCGQLRRLYERLHQDQDLVVGGGEGWGYRFLTVAHPGEHVWIFTGFPAD